MKKTNLKKKVFLITGVPGTGKTYLSKLLSKKLGYKLLELNKIAVKKKCIIGYDKKFDSKIVNLKKLNKNVEKIIKDSKENLMIEGHLGCELKLNVDAVIILRLDPFLLKKRLEKRKENIEKIKQNLEAEILDYCTITAEKNYKKEKIFEFNLTNKSKKDSLKILLDFIKFKNYKKEKINWSNYLLDEKFCKAFL